LILINDGEGTTTIDKLIPGTYIVTEESLGAEWEVDITGSGVVVANQTAVVDITNTYKTGCLEINKEFIFGEVVGYDFDVEEISVKIEGPSYPDPGEIFTIDIDEYGVGSREFCDLIPGTYIVTEESLGAEWDVEITGDGVVVANETAVIDITNTYETGCLEVNKEFIFGEVVGYDFDVEEITIKIIGPSYPDPGESFTIDIDEYGVGSREFCDLIPGTYIVTEESLGAEWDVEITGDGVVVANETAVVNITNTYVQCYKDETAWAYGEEFANENWNYVDNKFWGWTNGPLSEGNYEFDLYAGAGQNILSNGELVGKVYVCYEDGNVTVSYEITSPGVYLGEVHLWVGNDPLPSVKQGKKMVKTNAPGQFPFGGSYDFESGERETVWTSDPIPMTGNIYVAAHAVVWIPIECPEAGL
jgi:NAD(P)H-flavin reductase